MTAGGVSGGRSVVRGEDRGGWSGWVGPGCGGWFDVGLPSFLPARGGRSWCPPVTACGLPALLRRMCPRYPERVLESVEVFSGALTCDDLATSANFGAFFASGGKITGVGAAPVDLDRPRSTSDHPSPPSTLTAEHPPSLSTVHPSGTGTLTSPCGTPASRPPPSVTDASGVALSQHHPPHPNKPFAVGRR